MRIRVHGRAPLSGIYQPGGNANAAQALLAAALLTDAPVTLHNMPHTLSTRAMFDAAGALGAAVEWHEHESSVMVSGAQITRRVLSHTDSDVSLAAILFLPPLLMRRRHVRLEVDFPINRIRPHLEAMRDLGIDVVASAGAVDFKAAEWDKKDILLTQASVTATALV